MRRSVEIGAEWSTLDIDGRRRPTLAVQPIFQNGNYAVQPDGKHPAIYPRLSSIVRQSA